MADPSSFDPDAWSYSGATGPDHWDEFAPICTEGRRQSPINLAGFTPGSLEPLRFAYDVRAREIVNNGHNVQVYFAPGGALAVGERRYALDHLHFHVPSEHRLEGREFKMEAHFVHADEAGNAAVLALLYGAGKRDPTFAKLETHLPGRARETDEPEAPFSAADFLPPARDYYFYTGSLTTPPATEGVSWFVLKAIQSIETAETLRLLRANGGENARPLQERNGRKVYC